MAFAVTFACINALLASPSVAMPSPVRLSPQPHADEEGDDIRTAIMASTLVQDLLDDEEDTSPGSLAETVGAPPQRAFCGVYRQTMPANFARVNGKKGMASPQECAVMCAGDPKCTSFVFVTAKSDKDHKTCYMANKSSVQSWDAVDKSKNPCCSAGPPCPVENLVKPLVAKIGHLKQEKNELKKELRQHIKQLHHQTKEVTQNEEQLQHDQGAVSDIEERTQLMGEVSKVESSARWLRGGLVMTSLLLVFVVVYFNAQKFMITK